MVRIPRGFGKLLGNERFAWFFPTAPIGKATRRRGLGAGQDARRIERGQRHGLQPWRPGRLGRPRRCVRQPAWGWDAIVPHYKAMEDNQFGASPTRGVGGPLGISSGTIRSDLTDDMIAAGAGIGLERVDDLNEVDGERIGYAMANIKGGERVSAAQAFLHPVAKRPNLTVAIDSPVTSRSCSRATRSSAYRSARAATSSEHRASREVILALGSIQTPKLLQLSGIGPSEVLRAAGDRRPRRPTQRRRAHARAPLLRAPVPPQARTSATTASSAARSRRR